MLPFGGGVDISGPVVPVTGGILSEEVVIPVDGRVVFGGVVVPVEEVPVAADVLTLLVVIRPHTKNNFPSYDKYIK